MNSRRIQRIALVLWPSFIVGGIATAFFFSLFDPETLPLGGTIVTFGEGNLIDDRILIYSTGFFIFWMFAAASSWLTSFLQRPPDEVNRESFAAGDKLDTVGTDERRQSAS